MPCKSTPLFNSHEKTMQGKKNIMQKKHIFHKICNFVCWIVFDMEKYFYYIFRNIFLSFLDVFFFFIL